MPVVGEPIGAPEVYGEDRCFVVLRLDGDDNAKLDRATQNLRAQHPLLVRNLSDVYDLGAEMYCWESPPRWPVPS